ncbi:MAG TPA: haloacid dehalogenase type II, partial [Candidatus Limnocylindrales bacterium]|nr:haloacid dehalogenase type II [Candidatus Limnocylindrales bacterium]
MSAGPITGNRPRPALDLSNFDVLTFDCYGTLIDWETGIVAAARRAFGTDGNRPAGGRNAASGDELLEAFGRHEAAIEAGPYRPYREVLAETLRAIAAERGVVLDEAALATFGASVADWPAFPDAPAALAALGMQYRLGVITNCDDDLFAASAARLGVAFDPVVTAQQTRRYKPNPRGFELAFERIGLPTRRILHVAQSLFHDHAPAQRLGFRSVWIDRRHDRPGTGATPTSGAQPDATF